MLILFRQVWVNYVASSPLQNTMHQLRFPLIISLVFLIIALALELCRVTLSMFKVDRRKWRDIDETVDGSSEVLRETSRGECETATSAK